MTITFNCFITCLLEAYQDRLFPAPIKMGYTIGFPVHIIPGVETNRANQPSAVLAVNIHTVDESITADALLQQVKTIFDDNNLYYYSIVVFGVKHIAWSGSNIVFTSSTKEVPQLPPAKNNSELN